MAFFKVQAVNNQWKKKSSNYSEHPSASKFSQKQRCFFRYNSVAGAKALGVLVGALSFFCAWSYDLTRCCGWGSHEHNCSKSGQLNILPILNCQGLFFKINQLNLSTYLSMYPSMHEQCIYVYTYTNLSINIDDSFMNWIAGATESNSNNNGWLIRGIAGWSPTFCLRSEEYELCPTSMNISGSSGTYYPGTVYRTRHKKSWNSISERQNSRVQP